MQSSTCTLLTYDVLHDAVAHVLFLENFVMDRVIDRVETLGLLKCIWG